MWIKKKNIGPNREKRKQNKNHWERRKSIPRWQNEMSTIIRLLTDQEPFFIFLLKNMKMQIDKEQNL